MASICKPFRFGPQPLTTTMTVNLLNPGTTTGGILWKSDATTGTFVDGQGAKYLNTRIVLRHIRILNKTASAGTFSLWIGGTGGNVAGTEFIGTAYNVAANSAFDWYGQIPLDVNDFLVGGASANTTLTIEGEGEVGIA